MLSEVVCCKYNTIIVKVMYKKISLILGMIIMLTGCGTDDAVQEQENAITLSSEPRSEMNGGGGVAPPPEGCVVWFDGCNNCQVGAPGAPMACTMKYCPSESMQEPYCAEYADGRSDTMPQKNTVSAEVERGIKNATYSIEGRDVTLVNGMSEVAAALGSAAQVTTQTTSHMAEGDLQQGTGATRDGAVVLTQNTGGSGIFYYVGAVVQQSGQIYVAADNTYLLGDRVVIKKIMIDGRMIHVTYMDRNATDPMTTEPSVEVTKKYAIKGGSDDTLMDVTQ